MLDKDCFVLENRHWICQLGIGFNAENEPIAFACRNHSSNDHYDYMHLPTNPTGSLSYEGDNALAEVRAVPRTVRSFVPKRKTSSCQVNKVTAPNNQNRLQSLMKQFVAFNPHLASSIKTFSKQNLI